MKAYYRLLNHEFSKMLRTSLLLCAGAVVFELYLLHLSFKDNGIYEKRFESLYASSGCILLFLLFLFVLLVYFLKTIYADYWGSKGIYTMLTLPVKREAIYFGKLSAFTVCLLMFLAAELLSVVFGYDMYVSRELSVAHGQYLMHNAYFLAWIRSPFLRILLPLSPVGGISTGSMAIALLTGLYYGALCERSRRYWGGLLLAAALVFVIRIVDELMKDPLQQISTANLYVSSAVLLALSVFFVWHSIRLIKKGAIA